MVNHKIVIASDHAGYNLKEFIIKYLKDKYIIEDIGIYSEESVDYPNFGFSAVSKVANNIYDKGILICGSGIGMSIVANKVKNIRAALCNSVEIACFSRKHNNSNILVLPGRYIDTELTREIDDIWFKTDFDGGRHLRRLNIINQYEKEHLK